MEQKLLMHLPKQELIKILESLLNKGIISEYDLNYLITSFVPSCDPDHLFDLAEMHFRTQIENDAKSYQLAMYASFIGITIIKREIHTITQNVL